MTIRICLCGVLSVSDIGRQDKLVFFKSLNCLWRIMASNTNRILLYDTVAADNKQNLLIDSGTFAKEPEVLSPTGYSSIPHCSYSGYMEEIKKQVLGFPTETVYWFFFSLLFCINRTCMASSFHISLSVSYTHRSILFPLSLSSVQSESISICFTDMKGKTCLLPKHIYNIIYLSLCVCVCVCAGGSTVT